MTNSLARSDQWKLIVIPDPKAIPGKSIYDLVFLLSKIVSIKYVFLADLSGAGPFFAINENKSILEISKFLKMVSSVTQFDWGDFFLFSYNPNNIEEIKNLDYQKVIELTETTIRAVDDTYMYVYTPYEEVSSIIIKNYRVESVQGGKLEIEDYPY